MSERIILWDEWGTGVEWLDLPVREYDALLEVALARAEERRKENRKAQQASKGVHT